MAPADADTTPHKEGTSLKLFAAAGCLGAIAGAAGILAVLLGAYGFFQKQAVQKMAEVKELKPVQLRADFDWQATGTDGTVLDMAGLQGKPVFLHLWRPGCVSCAAEVPGVNALFEAFQAKGVAFVSIALGDKADLIGDLQMGAVQYPVYTLEGSVLPPVFQTLSTPTTFIISRGGFVVYSHSGAVDWDSPDARSFLDALCAE